MATKQQPESLNVTIPAPNIKEIPVTIKGLTPLIYHRWSEKAKRQMLEKQMKKAQRGHEIRNPRKEYEESFYKNSKGEIAFPAGSIKKAIVGAARSIDGVPMTQIRGAIFVVGDGEGLIKVDYKKKVMREDMVRVGKGSADLRYRGELRDWSMKFKIRFNENVFSAEQVFNLLATSGFSQGLGEWRPERNGDFGTFEIV